MIQSSLGAVPWHQRQVVAVSDAEISRSRSLLEQLGEKVRGAPLTIYQKRGIARLAPRVAIRQKQGMKPVLSSLQAMSLFRLVSRG